MADRAPCAHRALNGRVLRVRSLALLSIYLYGFCLLVSLLSREGGNALFWWYCHHSYYEFLSRIISSELVNQVYLHISPRLPLLYYIQRIYVDKFLQHFLQNEHNPFSWNLNLCKWTELKFSQFTHSWLNKYLFYFSSWNIIKWH